MEKSKNAILDFLKESARPLSLNELAKGLGIPRTGKESFRRLVREMLSKGELVKIRGERYAAPSRMNLISGILSCHPDGFGFVEPEEGGEDLYVNSRNLKGAMHGDKVIARVEGYKKGGKREGSIVRIVERAHKKIVGRFERIKGVTAVTPSDKKISEPIIIPRGSAGAAKDGEIVEAEIIKWPLPRQSAIGRIVEVLGDPEDPDVEVEVIARKYGLPRKFPADIERHAKTIPGDVPPHELKGRVDLTGLTVVTIDGEKAKDFDDAVAIEKTKTGYKLFVSIADVSHYVKEGSLLDREAFSRGTSVYFPDRAIPMLPEEISNGIASLNPAVLRLTLSAEIEFDGEGNPVKTAFYESFIKSAERLTYSAVKNILEGSDDLVKARYACITGDLKTMEELALKLNKLRMKYGSIDFDLPEPEIIINIEGTVEDIVKAERNIAHRIIEEFMLAANKAAAELFIDKGYPFIYRVHEKPDPESVEEFKEFITGLGCHIEETITPKTFQRLLSELAGKPQERLVNHVLLRSMKQARYSEKNIGHFGLAFKDYTHFTSPIRRYPDLIVHRLLKKVLYGHYTPGEKERMAAALPELARHSSERERNAMGAEREITDLKKAQFMLDKTGEEFEGFISGVTSFGFFTELKDFFVEGLVHVSSLTDDYYTFNEKDHSLTGERTKKRFQPGMAVKVVVDKVDLERRRIDLKLKQEGELRRKNHEGRKRRKKI